MSPTHRGLSDALLIKALEYFWAKLWVLFEKYHKEILKRKEIDASCQNSVKETGLDAVLLNSPSNPVPFTPFTYLRHVKENEKFLFPFNIKYEIMPAFLKLLLIVRIEYKIFQTVLYQL